MGLTDTVKTAITKELDRLSMQIQYELKSACPKRTGEAASSIHIEEEGEFSRFIGSNNLHLYFASQGNGTGGIPKSGERKPLPISGKGGQIIAFRTSPFRNYEGKPFVRDVADRHR